MFGNERRFTIIKRHGTGAVAEQYETLQSLAHGGAVVRDGPFTAYYPNGRVAINADYRLGRRTGVQRVWHNNGKLAEEATFNARDKMEGVYTAYHFNGEVKETCMFDHDGRRQGTATVWHDNGEMYEESHHVAGKRDGPYATWYDSGTMMEETHYVDGKRHGPYRSWYPDGNPLVVATYEHDVPVGVYIRYGEDGVELCLAGEALNAADLATEVIPIPMPMPDQDPAPGPATEPAPTPESGPDTGPNSVAVPPIPVCIVCCVRRRDTCLIPCGHVCVCSDCSDAVEDRCPMCRAEIRERVKIFIP